jgi:DNA repair protein RadA/Sms
MAVWVCRRCKFTADEPWEDICPGCRGFYRWQKVGVDTKEQKARSTFAASATIANVEHVPTGVAGLDYILTGGLVPGDVIQFGGFRGAGKTTLLVTAQDALSRRRKCLYASSEQSDESIIQIAKRAGLTSDNVVVYGNQKYIEDTLEIVKRERPFCVVYDSLQKYVSRGCAGAAGSASQGTAVSSLIKEDCREAKRAGVVVNQMSRAGDLKGGTDVEHDLDCILILAYPGPKHEDAPGSSDEGIRVLTVDKNRNGSENLHNYWKMHGEMDERPGTIEWVPQRSLLDEEEPKGKYRMREG